MNADVKAFAANKDYLNAFIVALASKWSVNEPIVISTADAEGLTKVFRSEGKDLLDKGVKIEQVNGIQDLVLRIACRWFVQGELWRRRIYELLQGIPASAVSGNAILKTPTGL